MLMMIFVKLDFVLLGEGKSLKCVGILLLVVEWRKRFYWGNGLVE